MQRWSFMCSSNGCLLLLSQGKDIHLCLFPWIHLTARVLTKTKREREISWTMADLFFSFVGYGCGPSHQTELLARSESTENGNHFCSLNKKGLRVSDFGMSEKYHKFSKQHKRCTRNSCCSKLKMFAEWFEHIYVESSLCTISVLFLGLKLNW